jgi:replication-associated recombination protein RarA
VSLLFQTQIAQSGFEFPTPLSEKYRPRAIGDFLGLDKPKKILAGFCKRPSPSSWLFTGAPGVGKSSMGMAMCETIGAEFHHIPSQKCTVANIEDVIRQCWYAPFNGGFHFVQIDEANDMTDAAQLALLSKTDSTDPPPKTIFVFTCNETVRLEERFLSRCKVLEFSTYGLRESLSLFLAKVWTLETGKECTLDTLRLAKDACNNVRTALQELEMELLAR